MILEKRKVFDTKQHLIFELIGDKWVETTTLEVLTEEIDLAHVKKVSFRSGE